MKSLNDMYDTSVYDYYEVVRILVAKHCMRAKSILDVCSFANAKDRRVIEWFPWTIDRYGIYENSLLAFPLNRHFGIVTCLDVVEHEPQPRQFCRKLFDLAENAVVISVSHPTVELDKLVGWASHWPKEHHVAGNRLIALF